MTAPRPRPAYAVDRELLCISLRDFEARKAEITAELMRASTEVGCVTRLHCADSPSPTEPGRALLRCAGRCPGG